MNHSLIKYLLLILCLISYEYGFARIFNETVIEDPSQVEFCVDDIYNFQASPFQVSSYDDYPEIAQVYDGEDGFEEDGGTEDPCDGYVDGSGNCVPIGNLLPLCLFIILYGLRKWQRIIKIRR